MFYRLQLLARRLARRQGIATRRHRFVEMAQFVTLRYGGETTSAQGCLSDGTGTLYRLFFVA